MIAWGDESIRVVCNPPVYLLAATYGENDDALDTSALEEILPKGAYKLHWRDMSDKARALCRTMRIDHMEGWQDSRLWIPDQVLGAYGDVRSGVAKTSLRDEWNHLSPSVNIMEIWP